MYTVLITAYNEAATISAAMTAFLHQLPPSAELIVICPDVETTSVVHQFAVQDGRVRHIADPQQGKPAALNLGLQAARNDLIVLSDGDVRIADNALDPLLAPFTDKNVGAVTGQPISISPRETMLGYWSHLLVHGAHQERLRREMLAQFLICSGYLFAYRRRLVPQIPKDALAEDGVISHRIAEQGYAIRYTPSATVQVKYPSTYADWLRQKVRSTGGYAQNYVRSSPFQMRSARLEIVHGTKVALQFAQSPRELVWTLLLFAARLHLWWLIFWNVRVRKRPLTDLWVRVETTK